MDVIEAFKSTENYMSYFSELKKIHEEHENFFKTLVAEIEEKFQDLLNDKPTKNDNFTIPEIPKVKKEVKEKRESRSTKKTSVICKSITRSGIVNSQSEEEVIRRSSRIALKVNDATDGKIKVIYNDKDSSTVNKGKCTRNNSKVLQEKSTNVKKIIEKIEEAQKKKDIIMKISTEETKRKREERTRKAAAQREAVEKEKLEIALKQEKEKEEKFKLIQKQKEEKLKMDCLKKKQLAAIKAAETEERRKKEEAAKLAKIKEMDLKSESHDHYAIDHVLDGASSDEEEKPKNQIPSWATKENRKYPLIVQAYLNKKETVYPWFYNKNLKYPKLEELFSADVKTRPRTSSAFWNSKVVFDESFPVSS